MYESALSFTSRFGRSEIAAERIAGSTNLEDLPPVPVFPETLMRLELLLNERIIDLEAVCDAVLTDLGATLQVLRSANRFIEAQDADTVPIRSAVVYLGRDGLLQAMPALVDHSHRADATRIRRFWNASHALARLFVALAGHNTAIDPEKAYLTGLLFHLGKLPSVLGWGTTQFQADSLHSTAKFLIHHWALPRFLERALCGDQIDDD